jgi:DNA (cytosine-5)-methyltransferase 1
MGTPMMALSLCSGIGALDVAIQSVGVQTIGYCEYDPWCGEILQHRMASGHLDSAPLWRDLKTLDGYGLPAGVDLIYGGIPCQPHSNAGNRQGAEDPRDLWPATRRLLGEIRPRIFFLENVAGFTTRNGDTPAFAYSVIADLAALGYVGRAGIVQAADAGAPHSRARWFCLATLVNADGERPVYGQPEKHAAETGIQTFGDVSPGKRDVADAGYDRGTEQELQQGERTEVADSVAQSLAAAERTRRAWGSGSGTQGARGQASRAGSRGAFPPHRLSAEWPGIVAERPEYAPAIEPDLCGVVDGHTVELDKDRRKRLAALGNAVVPAQVIKALEVLV